MTSIRHEHRDLEVACALAPSQHHDRQEQWRQLNAQRDQGDQRDHGDQGHGTQPIPGGIRIWLRPQARALAEHLVRQEADCCGFLDLELASDGDRLRLDITSPAAGAEPVIAWLAGER